MQLVPHRPLSRPPSPALTWLEAHRYLRQNQCCLCDYGCLSAPRETCLAVAGELPRRRPSSSKVPVPHGDAAWESDEPEASSSPAASFLAAHRQLV